MEVADIEAVHYIHTIGARRTDKILLGGGEGGGCKLK